MLQTKYPPSPPTRPIIPADQGGKPGDLHFFPPAPEAPSPAKKVNCITIQKGFFPGESIYLVVRWVDPLRPVGGAI